MNTNNISLLDCTLRDGGYITKWDFGEEVIKGVAQALVDANLEYVEVGYLNNKPYERSEERRVGKEC